MIYRATKRAIYRDQADGSALDHSDQPDRETLNQPGIEATRGHEKGGLRVRSDIAFVFDEETILP